MAFSSSLSPDPTSNWPDRGQRIGNSQRLAVPVFPHIYWWPKSSIRSYGKAQMNFLTDPIFRRFYISSEFCVPPSDQKSQLGFFTEGYKSTGKVQFPSHLVTGLADLFPHLTRIWVLWCAGTCRASSHPAPFMLVLKTQNAFLPSLC